MTRTYRAEFFTTADYAVRSFEAETPEQALQLARQFYDDNIIDLDFRSYDGCDTGLDEIQIWDTAHGAQARWQSDDFRLRKAAPDLLAALQLTLPRYADLLVAAGADLKECDQYQTAKAAVAKAAPAGGARRRKVRGAPESGEPGGKRERLTGIIPYPAPGGLAMRAIIVNSEHRTITETEIDGSLKSLQHIVGGLIEPVYQGLDDHHHCFVNEEGLLNNPQHFFMFTDGHQPLAGNGVILSSTDDADEAPCTLSIDWVKEHVTFMGLEAARHWAQSH